MHAVVGDPRRQRSRRSGVGLAACEGDVGVAEDGEPLVAVFEAEVYVAEIGAVLYAGVWNVSIYVWLWISGGICSDVVRISEGGVLWF
jgi:hypothetical protein